MESEETNQIHTDDLVGYSAKMSPVWINDGNGIGYVVDLATSFNDYDKHYAYRYTENIDSGEWRELIVVNPYSLD